MQPKKMRAAMALATAVMLGGTVFTDAAVIEAFDNATVQPAGPRSGTSGKNFFNIEGSGNGAFASYGVADFNGASFDFGGPISQVSVFAVSLVQSNAAFTTDGGLRFYLSTNTAANIQPGSTVIYDAGAGEEGLGTQLDTLHLLGDALFTEVANGTVDRYQFSLSPAAEAYVLNAVNNDLTLRVVIAPTTATLAATYAGFSNATVAGPTLEIVPEPVGLAPLALFGLLVSKRRRASVGQ